MAALHSRKRLDHSLAIEPARICPVFLKFFELMEQRYAFTNESCIMDTGRAWRKTQGQHMPDFKGIENFQLVIFFVVPGLIALFVRSRFIAGRVPSVKENILIFVVLSLFYYSLTILLIEPAISIREPWILRASIWILLILVGPAIFGFVLGIAAQKEWFTRFANRLGLTIVHIIPAAWDWRFSSIQRDGMFVLVTLTSGEKVAGLFAENSFASSDMAERDLYIEEEYTVTDQGRWEIRPERVGILISAKEIRYIEFWAP